MSLSTNRIFITGGSGFVGTNLVDYFANRGWDVRNYDRLPPRNEEHAPYWVPGDLLNRHTTIDALRAFQPSAVLHFAARTDLDEKKDLAGYAANFEGVRNVIAAVGTTPSVERVIFASSQLVCELGYSPAHAQDYRPNTLYGESKVLMERIIHTTGELRTKWTIVRPTSLWGPWFDAPYKHFFLAIRRGLYFHSRGSQVLKQWGFVGNTVFQIWKILNSSPDAVHERTLYLADYEPIEFRAFADAVRIAMCARPIRTVPRAVLALAAQCGDLLQKLGWKHPPLTGFRLRTMETPEMHDLEPLRRIVGPLPYTTKKGIEITVQWLCDQGSIGGTAPGLRIWPLSLRPPSLRKSTSRK